MAEEKHYVVKVEVTEVTPPEVQPLPRDSVKKDKRVDEIAKVILVANNRYDAMSQAIKHLDLLRGGPSEVNTPQLGKGMKDNGS